MVVIDMSLQLQLWGKDDVLLVPSGAKEFRLMAAGWELLVDRNSNLDADNATMLIPY